ncbi:hypothetical protein [Marinimicrobium sp. ABcell2]|uniref:hypothetical protein n=1 Tax=Marinimicrobium sp. ABcell2 TaxID=3069751 RepID=UPI0027B60203|nr:hypothetical protein [Marinimicrobium sp. ABcell2]MDQ2078476.1 hypothetical protein [Marinimicrobium sp. ABcell2]
MNWNSALIIALAAATGVIGAQYIFGNQTVFGAVAAMGAALAAGLLMAWVHSIRKSKGNNRNV